MFSSVKIGKITHVSFSLHKIDKIVRVRERKPTERHLIVNIVNVKFGTVN